MKITKTATVGKMFSSLAKNKTYNRRMLLAITSGIPNIAIGKINLSAEGSDSLCIGLHEFFCITNAAANAVVAYGKPEKYF